MLPRWPHGENMGILPTTAPAPTCTEISLSHTASGCPLCGLGLNSEGDSGLTTSNSLEKFG